MGYESHYVLEVSIEVVAFHENSSHLPCDQPSTTYFHYHVQVIVYCISVLLHIRAH